MKIRMVLLGRPLKLAVDNLYPGQIQTPLPSVVVNGEEQYEVEEILKSRTRCKKMQYLDKWGRYV